ncbi:hypothetical protein [Actinoplanes sp. NPDC048796]|uniref:NACHT domain-containing protein n=1 Tax=Actinoplanes sp. NPDC048796 TaxID=3155640 RepID=UPI0033C6BFDD
MQAIFGVTVGRLCRVRSGAVGDELPFPLDAEGFLDLSSAGPVGRASDGSAGRLVSLLDAVRSGAVVLLGEPGLGKSTEFEALRADAAFASVEIVDAADITDTASFHEFVGRHLRTLPERSLGGDRQDGSVLRLGLIIDQIDECPIRQQLAGLLRSTLRNHDVTALNLVLGCRTADYPSNLTTTLTDIFGSCTVADLAPLTRAEATRLASSAEPGRGDALVSAAVDCGAGVLANVPLTLELLVRAFRHDKGLDATPDVLFARGVQQLVDEHDTDRAVTHDESTSAQRWAVAERVAARLMLSGRRTIWRGPVLDAGEHDLTVDSLAGGDERSDGHGFTITRRMVDATLATGLFTGRGANRLAFRHGSFAAFLAANYLVRHRVPTAQLQSLFLVAAGGAARAIPTSLRETAAWLVNADQNSADWLVEADPESLVPHSPLVDSPATRRLLVEAMLMRAPEIEAGDQAWARASRHLQHPGLDSQLSGVLSTAHSGQPAYPASAARVRLAVRLAREARSAAVADDLLRIAEHDEWDPGTRTRASLAAFEINPDESADRLRTVLMTLTDRGHAAAIDPHDELAGNLLRALWPARLPTVNVLPFLGRPENRVLFGTFRVFLSTFVEKLGSPDIDAVLRWALDTFDTDSYAPESDQRGIPSTFRDLLDDVTDRALSVPEASDHLELIAATMHQRLERHNRPAIPRALDLVHADGAEPDSVRSLRQTLAVRLITRMVAAEPFDRSTASNVVGSWPRNRASRYGTKVNDLPSGLRTGGRGALLSHTDFPWLFGLSAESEAADQPDLAQAYAMCAGMLFDLADDESATLAFSNRDHPVWPYIAWWFEPVAINSDMANRWRQSHADDAEDTASPENIAAFHQEVQRLFADVTSGDTDAFWKLAGALQFEPKTAFGPPRLDDDLLQFPAISLLIDAPARQLTDAAFLFVTNEHDHADEWLGQDVHDRRAWAGYLALALLQRRSRLNQIPSKRWTFWTAAIVNFHAVPSGAGDPEVKRQLLAYVVKHASQRLADVVKLYVRAEITRNNSASEIELINPGQAPSLTDAWLELAADLYKAITKTTDAAIVLPSDEALATAAERWEQMLAALLVLPDRRAIDLATWCLTCTETEMERVLAGRAGNLLWRSDPPQHVAAILQIAQTHPATGREIALATARSPLTGSPLADLAVGELVRIYRWFSDVFPPEEDPGWRPGAHFVGPKEQAREWRDKTLEALVGIGTTEAAGALARLRAEFPERPILLYSLVRCRAVAARDGWAAPTPAEVAELLNDAQRRFARSEHELRNTVLESLGAIAEDLAGHGDLLWDRIPKKFMPAGPKRADGWHPKHEYALQAYLLHELTLRLGRRGIIVNREVMIRPTDAGTGAGDRADILIETATRLTSMNGSTADRIAVVIEVKGSWNKDIRTSQRTQLAERYLPAAKTDTGIYLVGWYPVEQWTTADYRRSQAAHHTRDGLSAVLSEQSADILAGLGKSTLPYLLEIPLPHRDAPEDDPVTR